MPTPHIVQNTDYGSATESDKFEPEDTGSHLQVDYVPQNQLVDETPSKEKGESTTSTLNMNDILLGRGGHNNRYSGNERLRQIVAEQVYCYAKATKLKKSQMVRSLVKHIRSLDPPGRFLRVSGSESMWRDAGDKFATEKVSQVFRDAMAKYGLKNSVYVPKFATETVVTKMDPIDLLLSTAAAMDNANLEPSKVAVPNPQKIGNMQFEHMNRVSQHVKSIHSQLTLSKGEDDYENTVPGIHQIKGLQYLPYMKYSYAGGVDRQLQKGVTKNSK
jgi:hypothetical protein